MRTYSCKRNKLRNEYTIGRRVRNISIKKWKISYFKIKVVPFIINFLVETMPFVMYNMFLKGYPLEANTAPKN